jgi:hypothetical protein
MSPLAGIMSPRRRIVARNMSPPSVLFASLHLDGSAHMTVNTCGKKFFPTPAVSTEETITARLARRSKGSCSTIWSLARARRDHTRCCTLIHCVSSSSSNSSWGDANGVA